MSKSPEGNCPLGPWNLRKIVVSVLGLKLKAVNSIRQELSIITFI